MGVGAALKARDAVRFLETILALELMCAAQAIEFHRPLKAGRGVERAHDAIRRVLPPLDQDRFLQPDIAAVEQLVRSGAFASIHEIR